MVPKTRSFNNARPRGPAAKEIPPHLPIAPRSLRRCQGWGPLEYFGHVSFLLLEVSMVGHVTMEDVSHAWVFHPSTLNWTLSFPLFLAPEINKNRFPQMLPQSPPPCPWQFDLLFFFLIAPVFALALESPSAFALPLNPPLHFALPYP